MRKIFLFLSLLPLGVFTHADISGPPILSNDFKVEFIQGPVVGSARKVGMAGAFSAVGSGVESLSDNPAGVAVRPKYSTRLWDWDFTTGIDQVKSEDFDNNGSHSQSIKSAQFPSIGLLIQRAEWGLGFYAQGQNYIVDRAGSQNRFEFVQGQIALGHRSKNKEWTWGFSPRFVGLQMFQGTTQNKRILNLKGNGVEAGLIWNPKNGPLRFGLAYSGPLSPDQEDLSSSTTPVVIQGVIVPAEVTLPAKGTVGVAYTITTGDYFNVHPLIFSMDIRLQGKADNAVGVESFIEQKVQPAGESVTVGVHAGSEFEFLPGRLRLRLGTYREPSRFNGVNARQHLTAGFELRTVGIPLKDRHSIRLSYAVDYARDYVNNFFSLGFWHF